MYGNKELRKCMRGFGVLAALITAVLFSGAAFTGTAAQGEEPKFNIQLWDAQKTDWDDAALEELRTMGFTVVQNGYGDGGFPSPQFLEKITSHGLKYGAYINTPHLFVFQATDEENAAARRVVDWDGTVIPWELHSFDPTYKAVVQRAVQAGMLPIAGNKGLYKVLLNSERSAPLSYDDLTKSVAVNAGVMTEGESIPYFDRGVWVGRDLVRPLPIADPYRFVTWFGRYGGDRTINRAVAELVRAYSPDLKVTTDPIADGLGYGQYEGMDIYQDWVRVHQAPRDPLGIAYRTERLKAHVRHYGKGEVWIGPQLGTADGPQQYAAPADEFEEALWLAAAFGAKGVTFWGYNSLRRDVAMDMDTWSRVKKFHDILTGARAPLITAVDSPRVCAVFLSKANQVYSEKPYWAVENNYEHFYRCLLTAHVPADVLYDEDVLAGALSRYRAVFLPGIEYLTEDLEAAVTAYEAAGGRVIRWPITNVFYNDYDIAEGKCDPRATLAQLAVDTISMLPHQYRAWRRAKAAELFATVADLMPVRCATPDVIMNIVESGGVRYVVLVNDRRTYGPWTTARKYKICEDRGLSVVATLYIDRPDGTIKKVKMTVPRAGTRLYALPF